MQRSESAHIINKSGSWRPTTNGSGTLLEMPQKVVYLRLVASSSSATTSWRASSGVRPSSTLSGGARLLLSWDEIHKSHFDERLWLSWDGIHKSQFDERLGLSWDRIHKSHFDERLALALLRWNSIHKSHFDESLKTIGGWLFTIPGFFSDLGYFLTPQFKTMDLFSTVERGKMC